MARAMSHDRSPAKAGAQPDRGIWTPLHGHATPPAWLRSAGHCAPGNFAGEQDFREQAA
jgi:hypothetical protein